MDRRDGGRRGDDRRDDDRRKIERFSHAAVTQAFVQIRMFSFVLMGIAFLKGVYHLYVGITAGTPEALTYAVVAAALLFFMTGFFLRYTNAISAFSQNESVGNLERVLEEQSRLFLVFTFFVILSLLAYAVFA